MDAQTLRSIQAPLKAKYREDPESALITLHAEGKLGPDVTFVLNSDHTSIISGLHPASGGTGKEICSAEMLLWSLVSCAGVTMNAISTSMGLTLRDAKVSADGDVDFRGTLGVSKEVPVGFKEIRLHFTLDTDATLEEIATLIKLTERYCVVFQTLTAKPELTVTVSS
ncbi:MAG: OsmC family protein, partial [Bacteroidota bacterium]|nr:OsmC family protein [Bacteroidota bacterium]